MSGGAVMRLIREQEKRIDGVQEKAKPVAVEPQERQRAFEQTERERSIRRGSLLAPTKRLEIKEALLKESPESLQEPFLPVKAGSFKTRAGTEVTLIPFADGGFIISFQEQDRRRGNIIEYNAKGEFTRRGSGRNFEKSYFKP